MDETILRAYADDAGHGDAQWMAKELLRLRAVLEHIRRDAHFLTPYSLAKIADAGLRNVPVN